MCFSFCYFCNFLTSLLDRLLEYYFWEKLPIRIAIKEAPSWGTATLPPPRNSDPQNTVEVGWLKFSSWRSWQFDRIQFLFGLDRLFVCLYRVRQTYSKYISLSYQCHAIFVRPKNIEFIDFRSIIIFGTCNLLHSFLDLGIGAGLYWNSWMIFRTKPKRQPL